LTDYDYSDSEYESATTSVSEEGEVERILENPTVCEPSDHSLAAAVNIVPTQVLPDLNSITAQLAENIFQILVKYFIPTIEILVKYCFQILFQ
jgi:hypothetical protein